MKKLLLLLFVCIVTTSCSSDENSSSTDPIVGTWGLFSLVGPEASDCQKMSTVTFNVDGTANSTTYYENPNNNNACETVGDTPDSGTWENMGNGVYRIISSNNTTQSWEISFTDNNNTLNITNQNVVYKRR